MNNDESIYLDGELPPEDFFFLGDVLVDIYQVGEGYGWSCDRYEKYPETYIARPLYTKAGAYRAAKMHASRSNIYRKFKS